MVVQSQNQPNVLLNNGVSMPLLGLGVYAMHGKQAEQAVEEAFRIGYRLIDTAAMYHNESEVGRAFTASGLQRGEVFITSKVDNPDQGFDSTLRAFDKSLKNLGMDFMDLYLVHWPVRGKRQATWKALEKLYEQKRVRAIGVANYLLPFMVELLDYAVIPPAVNQVEFSPYLYLETLLDHCQKHNIQLQAYSPLVRGKKLKDPRLMELASKYHKTTAQIILRWDLELGVSAIPKSVTPERLKENFDIFDFSLSPADTDYMKGFNEDLRLVGDPMSNW
jgi:diketogulonate reductase-like aldo/keto reductase